MHITGPGIWGEPHDRVEALKVLKRAVELGVNFIDTAGAYGPEVSENLIAEALSSLQKRFGHRDQGRFRALWPQPMAGGRATGIPDAVRRNELAPPEAGVHRPLPAAPHRSQSAGGRVSED